jgi:hypothetical protein
MDEQTIRKVLAGGLAGCIFFHAAAHPFDLHTHQEGPVGLPQGSAAMTQQPGPTGLHFGVSK